MSKLAVLGASGRLGMQLIHQALSQDLEVHALTRDPKKVHGANERLTVFKGDLEKDLGVHEAVVGCKYVVSVVSSPHPSDCVAHLVKAIGMRKVERVVFVSRADDTVPSHGLSERLASGFGANRLCWGSDHPQDQRSTYAGKVELAHHATRTLEAADRDAVLAGTAMRLWFDV